jgi:hypothetical protein
VLAYRVPLHGKRQTSEFSRARGCLNFEVFHHEYRSNHPENSFKEIDSPWVKTLPGSILKKLYVSAGVFVVLVRVLEEVL